MTSQRGHHCGKFMARPLSRRDLLLRCANGFGLVALAALASEESARSAKDGAEIPSLALRANGETAVNHHPARARNVIFLYMDGGPSQVDTFDYKPLLERYHGRDPHSVFRVEPTQLNNVGRVMASPCRFRLYGMSVL